MNISDLGEYFVLAARLIGMVVTAYTTPEVHNDHVNDPLIEHIEAEPAPQNIEPTPLNVSDSAIPIPLDPRKVERVYRRAISLLRVTDDLRKLSLRFNEMMDALEEYPYADLKLLKVLSEHPKTLLIILSHLIESEISTDRVILFLNLVATAYPEIVSEKTIFEGRTLLHYAAQMGRSKIVIRLIQLGADVNATSREGFTPLHTAAYHGRDRMIEELIHAEALINAQSNWDETPLHSATKGGHIACVEKLLNLGANPNIQSHNGETALHMAVQAKRFDIVYLLTRAKANLNLRTTLRNGLNTPLHLAYNLEEDGIPIVVWLIACGANRTIGNRRHLCPTFKNPDLNSVATNMQIDLVDLMPQNHPWFSHASAELFDMSYRAFREQLFERNYVIENGIVRRIY